DEAHGTAKGAGRQLRKGRVLPFRPAISDRPVRAFDIPAGCKASPERRYVPGPLGGGGGVEKPNHRRRCLLRACRERPRRCRAAEECDELAALHSITLSARASS